VTFTIDGNPQPPVAIQMVRGGEQAAFSVSTLAAGRHTISATYSGDSTFAGSTVASPLVQVVNAQVTPGIDGPTVVSLERFGIHIQPTVVVLTFHDGLDPTSAEDLGNYRIVGPSGRSIELVSASFDRVANTVTLRPKTRINIHHTYWLTVMGTGPGGVRDQEGRLLDGANNGVPGSNFTGSIDWSNVMWTPAEAKKYDHPQHVKPAGPKHHRFVSRSR
jgi:hypothetical protein